MITNNTGNPTALQAALSGAATTPPPNTGSDVQNAALLASIAKGQAATPTQTQTALNALGSKINMPANSPQAFVQQQAAEAAAPGQLAGQIAGEQAAAQHAALGTVNGANSNYMSQVQAAYPLVDALAKAQVAQANNNFASQALQNSINQQQLQGQQQLLPGQLQLQKLQIQQQLQNPAAFMSPQQQAAAKQQVAVKMQGDPQLSANDKQALTSIFGSYNAYDYASALNTYNQIKTANKGQQLNDAAIQNYLNAYYAGNPNALGTTPAAPSTPAAQKQGGTSTGNAYINPYSPANIANGLKIIGQNIFNGA